MKSPLEAMAALEREQAAVAEQQHSSLAVGQRMLDVLATHGEILIAKWGLYGGTPGLVGSANPGRRITQSTMPTALGDGSFVALRHPIWTGYDDLPNYDVELVSTRNSGLDYCSPTAEPSGRHEPGSRMAEYERERGITYTEDTVIAGFFKNGRRNKEPGLEISGSREYSADQKDAVITLIDHIESSTRPIGEEWTRTVKKLPYEPIIGGSALREGASLVADVELSKLRIYIH